MARSIQSLLRESKNFILVNTLAQFSASTIAVQGTIVSGGDGQESELMRVNITLIFPGLSDTPLTSSPSTYEVSSYCGRLHSSMSLCFIWYHVTQYTARPAAHNCDVDSFCRSVWYLRLSQHYTARWTNQLTWLSNPPWDIHIHSYSTWSKFVVMSSSWDKKKFSPKSVWEICSSQHRHIS